MGILDWLAGIFSSKKTRRGPVDEAGLEFLRQTRATHIRDYVGLEPGEPATAADLTASRVGGPVAWPDGEAPPTDAKGQPMLFLAQINFADMPSLDPFPTQGLMQVFVPDDDVFGCEFPSTDQKGFRVAYHEDTSSLVPHHPFADRLPESHPFQSETVLREGLRLVTPTKGQMMPRLASKELDALWSSTTSQFNDATWSAFEDASMGDPMPEVHFGGHPDFTQTDPRIDDAYSHFEICILQLMSDRVFMWGDVGIANFFMTEEDLRHRRFEKAIFNWDCS